MFDPSYVQKAEAIQAFRISKIVLFLFLRRCDISLYA